VASPKRQTKIARLGLGGGKAVISSYCELSKMKKIILFIIATLVFCVCTAHAACSEKNETQIIEILNHGADLNERFKESVHSGDDAQYYTFRKKSERYNEDVAIPCLNRAQVLLRRGNNHLLMLGFLEFVISHENSADERIPIAMATLFSNHSQIIQRELTDFPVEKKRAIIRSIDSGWETALKTLSKTQKKKLQLEFSRLKQAK